MWLQLFRFFIFNVTVFLLSAPLTGVGNAGIVIDADSQFDYAQSRFDDRAYEESITEFNRFIHFFPTDKRVSKAEFQIGMAYLHSGRYGKAVGVFDSLAAESGDDALAAEAYLMLSRSRAGLGQTDQAMVDLRNLMAVSSDPGVLDRAHYELAWLFIDQGRWEEAELSVSRITGENAGRFRVDELQRALSRSDRIPAKSPTTAGVLSILPGAGQLYCGRYQDALAAFLVNAGLIWAGWEAFDNDLYALGSIIAFVEFGFYAGNIYGAVSGAHKYNRDRRSEFRNGLIQNNRLQVTMGPIPGGWAANLCMKF